MSQPQLETPLVMQPNTGDTVTYDAQHFRRYNDAAWDEGVVRAGDLKVYEHGGTPNDNSAAGPNWTVDVDKGQIVITGDDVTNQGSYLCTSNAVSNVALPLVSGRPTNGTHTIVARVRDKNANSSVHTTYEWQIQAIAPGGAIPPSSVTLATISVAAGQANIRDTSITDKRVQPNTLNSLSDVDTTGGTTNQALIKNASGIWVPATITIDSTSHTHSLDMLSDVDTTGAITGNVIIRQSNGTWTPGTISTVHNHDGVYAPIDLTSQRLGIVRAADRTQSTFSFSAIDQNYTNLIIRIRGSHTGSARQDVWVRLNDVTSSYYDWSWWLWWGDDSHTQAAVQADNKMILGQFGGVDCTMTIQINGYKEPNNVSVHADGYMQRDNTPQQGIMKGGGRATNFGDPSVTKITVGCGLPFDTYTTIELIGER